MSSDPFEKLDLGGSPSHTCVLQKCEAKLRTIVDPEAANAQAFADQKRMIDANGGIDAIKAQAEIGYSPAPTT